MSALGVLANASVLAGCDPRWWEHGGGGSGHSSVCHCTPAGCSTLTVANAAVQAHLDHGDSLGECAPPPEAEVEGTWSGTIALSPYRPYTVTFATRANGEVLGYVMGGTRHRTIIRGTRTGSYVELTLRKVDDRHTELVEITGTITGDVFTGNTPSGPFTLYRSDEVLLEENFVFLYTAPNLQVISIEAAVVTTEDGDFVSGGFVTSLGFGCDPLACGGGITDFSIVNDVISLELETGGVGVPCDGTQGTGSITGTYDPGSGAFESTFDFVNCDGGNPRSGPINVYQRMGTDSESIQQVLAGFGALADDLEDTGTALATPHPSFHSGYFHAGKDLADLFAGYEAERLGRLDYTVHFSRFASLFTRSGEYMLDYFRSDPRVSHHETRSWTTDAGIDTAYDHDSDRPLDQLAWLAFESGSWRIRGNGASTEPVVGLPIEDPLQCSTTECQVVQVWPFGVHDGGHPEGHEGIDFRFRGSAWITASHEGEVARLHVSTPDEDDDPNTPPPRPQLTVAVRGGGVVTTYQHLDPDSVCCGTSCSGAPGVVELCVDDYVGRGQRIGRSSGVGEETHIHWDLEYLGQPGKVCPWFALDAAGRTRVEQAASAAPWLGRFTEPLLCGQVGRTTADFMPPLSTLWVQDVDAPGSVHAVRFTRVSPDASHSYVLLDENGVILGTGEVCVSGSDITLAPTGTSCAMGGSVAVAQTFVPSGTSATLSFAPYPYSAGLYRPIFE